jgi:hypothetical protein
MGEPPNFRFLPRFPKILDRLAADAEIMDRLNDQDVVLWQFWPARTGEALSYLSLI